MVGGVDGRSALLSRCFGEGNGVAGAGGLAEGLDETGLGRGVAVGGVGGRGEGGGRKGDAGWVLLLLRRGGGRGGGRRGEGGVEGGGGVGEGILGHYGGRVGGEGRNRLSFRSFSARTTRRSGGTDRLGLGLTRLRLSGRILGIRHAVRFRSIQLLRPRGQHGVSLHSQLPETHD